MYKNFLKSFANLEKFVKIVNLDTSSVKTKTLKNLKIDILIDKGMLCQNFIFKKLNSN